MHFCTDALSLVVPTCHCSRLRAGNAHDGAAADEALPQDPQNLAWLSTWRRCGSVPAQAHELSQHRRLCSDWTALVWLQEEMLGKVQEGEWGVLIMDPQSTRVMSAACRVSEILNFNVACEHFGAFLAAGLAVTPARASPDCCAVMRIFTSAACMKGLSMIAVEHRLNMDSGIEAVSASTCCSGGRPVQAAGAAAPGGGHLLRHAFACQHRQDRGRLAGTGFACCRSSPADIWPGASSGMLIYPLHSRIRCS